MINHRDLLKKYMDHIGHLEGTDFLSDRYEGYFAPKEWKELIAISDESDAECKARLEALQRLSDIHQELERELGEEPWIETRGRES